MRFLQTLACRHCFIEIYKTGPQLEKIGKKKFPDFFIRKKIFFLERVER